MWPDKSGFTGYVKFRRLVAEMSNLQEGTQKMRNF
jgi:hypothetical protein